MTYTVHGKHCDYRGALVELLHHAHLAQSLLLSALRIDNRAALGKATAMLRETAREARSLTRQLAAEAAPTPVEQEPEAPPAMPEPVWPLKPAPGNGMVKPCPVEPQGRPAVQPKLSTSTPEPVDFTLLVARGPEADLEPEAQADAEVELDKVAAILARSRERRAGAMSHGGDRQRRRFGTRQ